MRLKHSFKKMEPQQAIQEYAEERFDKIGKLLLKDSTWQVCYSRSSRYEFRVEVLVRNPEGQCKASAVSDSYFEAIDKVADKLSSQFHKMKDRLQSHHKYERSKQGRLERVNPRLEYDGTPFPQKKSA